MRVRHVFVILTVVPLLAEILIGYLTSGGTLPLEANSLPVTPILLFQILLWGWIIVFSPVFPFLLYLSYLLDGVRIKNVTKRLSLFALFVAVPFAFTYYFIFHNLFPAGSILFGVSITLTFAMAYVFGTHRGSESTLSQKKRAFQEN